MTPDPWQARLLREAPRRSLLCCSRQSGKSQTAAALALAAALLRPGSLVLLLSPSLRQSGELFRKVMGVYQSAGRPVPSVRPKDNALRLELTNGSRVVSLPGVEATVRSFSAVRLLVIDEAARVPDALYAAVRPMLAVSHGSLIALSTPFARIGWFFEAWHDGAAAWHRVRVPATECPRISPEFLAEEREELGERWYSMEYECVFTDAVDALFTEDQVRAAMSNDRQPLFPGGLFTDA
jgi:hypothetical protein